MFFTSCMLLKMGSLPKYGKRLLPTLIDELAKEAPDRVYVQYAGPDWESNGYRNLTYGQLSSAVDGVSHWLDEKLGPSQDFETLAYWGSTDARYAFLFVAAIKLGGR